MLVITFYTMPPAPYVTPQSTYRFCLLEAVSSWHNHAQPRRLWAVEMNWKYSSIGRGFVWLPLRCPDGGLLYKAPA